MRILVTGNMGYIGPVLARHLRGVMPDAVLIGYDTCFFGHCLTNADRFPESIFDVQHFGDIRELPAQVLTDVDAVVHLSAVSNDPMGKRFERVTKEINQTATIRLAQIARDAGVQNFIFASSCSMYGFSEGGARKETDDLNPLTAYARSKVGAEKELRQMDLGGMTVTCLRFGTACGMSERLRLDLVLNDFVACAIASGEITVLSDGSPWRPLIDVEDMSRAIEWGVTRKAGNGGQILSVNVGVDGWNYQVKDLAAAVASAVPCTKVSINTEAPPDKRSYQVNFEKFRKLAPNHQPRITLDESIRRLRDGLMGMGFNDANFRNSPYMRLKMLENHIEAGRVSSDLYWVQTIGGSSSRPGASSSS